VFNNNQPQPKVHRSTLWLVVVALSLGVVLIVLITISIVANRIDEKPKVGVNVQRILDQGEVKIGTDATFLPMEFYDENGNLTGFDMELANKIAEVIGVKATIISYPWDELFEHLKNGDVDLIISSVTINDERRQLYDFSTSYISAGQVIITQRSDNSINSTTDLSGKKIGVQTGTTNETEALKYTTDDLVIRYPDFNVAAKALVEGEINAIFSDLPGAKGLINDNPTLKISSDPFTEENYGVVIKKGSDDLVERVNEVLDSLRQQGFLQYLQQKWLE
jgi:ABC-type amino acid transport substrate-binding protein